MIIGYYPGAGGNRFYQYINNLEYSRSGIHYDVLTNNNIIHSRGLYFNDDKTVETFGTMLIHCVNYGRISEKINVNDSNTYIIKSDLKASLRREWGIKGKFKPMSGPNLTEENFILETYRAIKDPAWPIITSLLDYKSLPEIIFNEVQIAVNENYKSTDVGHTHNFLNAAYTSIAWHNDLYKKFPFDPGRANLIDIDNDETDFAKLMRQELDIYKDDTLFNFAWEIYTECGNNAPIIDLFNERYPDGTE